MWLYARNLLFPCIFASGYKDLDVDNNVERGLAVIKHRSN